VVNKVKDFQNCAESSKDELGAFAVFATLLPEVRHDGQITTVCLSTKTNERYIVCGSTDGNLSVFDRQLNHRQSILVGHDDQVFASLLLWTMRSSYSDF